MRTDNIFSSFQKTLAGKCAKLMTMCKIDDTTARNHIFLHFCKFEEEIRGRVRGGIIKNNNDAIRWENMTYNPIFLNLIFIQILTL